MHIDMLNIPNFSSYDLTEVRGAYTAGAICHIELIKEMKVKYGIEGVTSGYGQTECSPIFYQSLPDDSDELRSTTVGYPHEHTEVKVINKEGEIVPIGTKGEMCARGYFVMKGYWDDPIKTAEAIDQDQWLHTG